MKRSLIILLAAWPAFGGPPTPMPDAAPFPPYDLALEFLPNPGATSFQLYTNGAAYLATTNQIVFITNLPPGTTTFTATASNRYGVGLTGNAIVVTNTPLLTNTAVTVTATYTWAATNPPVSQMFFALCSSTNPAGPWRPVPTAARPNVFPSGVNIATKTNFN